MRYTEDIEFKVENKEGSYVNCSEVFVARNLTFVRTAPRWDCLTLVFAEVALLCLGQFSAGHLSC